MTIILIDESRVGHIFRNASGHCRYDSEKNREMLINVANDPSNFLGIDAVGNAWYAEMLSDASEVWVRGRSGKIVNGRINKQPRGPRGLLR